MRLRIKNQAIRIINVKAVLVAIAIPIFTSQLEKSREATDIANIRDYYAQVSVGLLDGSLEKATDKMTVANGVEAELKTLVAATDSANGSMTVEVTGVDVQQSVFGTWNISDNTVAGAAVAAPAEGDNIVTFSFTIEKGTYTTYLTSIAYSH